MDEMLLYALDYARRGFAVFPLKPHDKAPITVNGVNAATTDEAQIETWWRKTPNANIGIATGQISGGICVIDMDIDEESGKNGIRTLKDWQDRYGVIPPSATVRTGRGGLHYYFRAQKEVRNRVNLLGGVDIRGDGGYVVAPPSVHSNGNKYEWAVPIEERGIVDIDNNIEYLLFHEDSLSKPSYIAPDIIPQGERNGSMFKFACMLQAKGVSDAAIYSAAMDENMAKCKPPLTEKEINLIVKSVFRYEKGKPIYVSNDGKSASQGEREPVFSVDKKGLIRKTWDNMREAIEYDPELYGKIRYNELANSIFVYGELPWEKKETYRAWKNSDDASLKSYLEKRYGFNSTEKIMDALTIVSDKYKFNPIVDELMQIHAELGDGSKGAIRKLLPEYMGCEDTDYYAEVMTLYMLGAISRVFHPGCKFDYSIILYGAQGFGKSEFLRHLAICSEWFNDNFGTFEGDKAIEKLSGMWIIEMAELKALKSAKDAETFKAFLTSRVDTYRAPYSRRSEQRPRMCVFAGTTNTKNIFVDKTGNRRFLPINTRKGKQKKDLFGDQDKVMHDFRLAWAEAMEIFLEADKSPNLILSEASQKVAEVMQNEFSEDDYRVGMIQNWLDTTDVEKVCVPMIIESALGIQLDKLPKPQKREISEIMDNEIKGWERVKTKDKGRMRFGQYGSQVAYMRKNNL